METSYALQALASLTCLTWLNLGGTAVSAGLQPLTSLEGLASLNLRDCVGVTDEHLQHLSALKGLTWLGLAGTAVSTALQQLTSLEGLAGLNLSDCVGVKDEHLQPLGALTGLTWLSAGGAGVQGSSLAALTGLRLLDVYSCSSLDAAALSVVAQLTRLTFLDVSHSATEAQPAQLAQLAQLTNLQVLRLWEHAISDQAAALLQLPRLGELCASGITVHQGQDLSGCAITRLVLDEPTAEGPQALPQLPALQSLRIGGARAGLANISVQTQLTELAVGVFDDVQASELAAALRGLKQLQALELGRAGCFDMECLLAVAGMPQLRELWLDGGAEGLAPGMGNCWGMLHRCTQLQRVTLQRCGPISQGAMVTLVFQLGMQKVVLRGEHGLAAEDIAELQELGAGQGCELLCKEEVCPAPLCDVYFNIPV